MNILLFGATGHAGRAIAQELEARKMDYTAVVRSREKAVAVGLPAGRCLVADVMKPADIQDICKGYDVVISGLGKSVSLNDRSKPSFTDVDLDANSRILESALRHRVRKMVYISAFNAERYTHLAYFKVHHEFSERLVASGINYSIIKPTGLFSAFLDLIPMARSKRLWNIGKGEYTTNILHERDLARLTVDAINDTNTIVDAGGGHIYKRREINQLIQDAVLPRKVPTLPAGLVRLMLPVLKLADRNTYDKLAFFMAVMEEDLLAPRLGTASFEEYIKGAAAQQ